MGGTADINPLHGSLFTGAGTSWGPSSTGDPGQRPGAPADRNLSDFSAFDQSEKVKRVKEGLRGGQAQEELGARRRASRMGAGNSDASRMIQQGVATNTQNRMKDVELDAAKASWDSQMAQKQHAEDMDMKRYAIALDAWKTDKAANEATKQARREKLGPFGIMLGD